MTATYASAQLCRLDYLDARLYRDLARALRIRPKGETPLVIE
jgi:hypothetical protein